jgi:hypothetical protein
VFLQLSWIDLFGSSRDYLPLETLKLQEVLLAKLNQLSQGNNVLDAPASNTDGFLRVIHVSHQLILICSFGTKWDFLHLESYDLQDVFLSEITQFWQVNNMLDSPASNTDGSLREIYVFLQLSWMGLLAAKWANIHIENYDFQEVFLSKTNSILRGKQCTRCCHS